MRKSIIICVYLISAFTIGNADDEKANKTSIPFSASFFEIPSTNPVRGWHYHNVVVAGIPMNDSTFSIKVVWGLDSTETNQYWLAVLRTDGSSELSQLQFTKGDNDQLGYKLTIHPYVGRAEGYSLELRLLASSRTILYRWLSSNSLSSNTIEAPVLNESQIRVNYQIPNISLTSLSGQTLKLDEMRGHIIVINWWSIACAPCELERPGLNKLVQKYKDRNINFIAIAWNGKSEIQEFLKKQPFDYKQYVHNKTTDSVFGNSYPRNVIVNKDGLVVYDKIGGSVNTYTDLEKAIEKELAIKK